jgi:hypothetical protein
LINQSELDLNLNFALRPLTTYSFVTEDAYFSSTPRVNIISREKTKIEFEVPIEVTFVDIETRHNEEEIEVRYEVIL